MSGLGTKGGDSSFVGFVRASSLSRSGGSSNSASGQSKAAHATPTNITALSAVPTAAAAPAAAAASTVRPSEPVPKPSSVSSWGSLGRGGGGGRSTPFSHSMNRDKAVKLPLHVVGLQFRENSAAWSAPPAPASPGQQGEHQQYPAEPPTSPHSIGGDTALELEREPYNSHDRNAIKVLLPASRQPQQSPPGGQPSAQSSRFLGYIPGRIAVLLAPLLDASPPPARVTLKSLQEDEEEEGGAGRSGPRNTLPALLEVKPLDGARREPFSGLISKVSVVALSLVFYFRRLKMKDLL